MKTSFCLILLLIITFSCQKELSPENIVATLPTLTTTAATSITATTATSGGNITDNGGAAITARGVCWSTTSNPTVALSTKTTDGTGSGVFSSNITGLTATTVYYVRAYATNSAGTAYGNEISFTSTNTSTALPTVTTASLSSVTMTTAAGGGNVVADGGATVTARGVCWSTTVNPTVALSTKTTDGTGTGIFASAITGLTAATTYHVRAYATNSVGTSYGGDSLFTTASTATIPTITTAAILAITNTTANSGGTISTDGGAAVTARGVCWSTTPNPTIALSTKTIDGTGIGTFTSAITGLTAATLYHVRAYATNSVGTAYGDDVSFTTLTPNIYVTGYDLNTAVLWKNGVATNLNTPPSPSRAEGSAVFVSGSDVYVAGYQTNPAQTGETVARVWKNGVATDLTNGSNFASANSVFVSGTDVFAAGYENNAITSVAKIWKNGVATSLTNGTDEGQAYNVFVSGSDVYIAGYEASGINRIAKVWKNGVATSLTNGANDAIAVSVFVSGTDVYVVGAEVGAGSTAKMWKNGVATSLTSGTTVAAAVSVFVSGTDVYISGFESNAAGIFVAKIWKNGIATSLTNGTTDAYGNGIYVFGSDVYVAVDESNGTKTVAKFFKNGVATTLTNGTNDAAAYSIFVK